MPEPNDSPSPSSPNATSQEKSEETTAKRKGRGRAGWLPHSEGPVNSVSSEGARAASTETPKPEGASRPKSGTSTFDANSVVPEHISAKYLRVGSRYYFTDRDPAFRVGVTKTTTQLDSPEVVRDIIEIERARAGGEPLELRGSQKFRREAWRQATLLEIETRGYRPSKVERAQMEREAVALAAVRKGVDGHSASIDSPSTAPGTPETVESASQAPRRTNGEREPPVPRDLQLVQGRLVEHGAAPREHDRHQPMSHFVKIETREGEVKTIWGDDFPRALKESLSSVKKGDQIVARYVNDRAIAATVRSADNQGNVTRREEVREIQNRWIVEKQAFIKEREALAHLVREPNTKPKEAVQRHPSLAGAFVEIHVGELIAKANYRDADAQRRFMERLRTQVADEIARGEKLPVAEVFKVSSADKRRTRDRVQDRVLS